MDAPSHLPIRPTASTLEAHILALDKISIQLSRFPSKTRWPARIPLNSKASFHGELIHTNEVKVNVGDGWWIEMTAEEAREYIERRKTALLLEHAKITEGSTAGNSSAMGSTLRTWVHSPPQITFNPLFAMPQRPEETPANGNEPIQLISPLSPDDTKRPEEPSSLPTTTDKATPAVDSSPPRTSQSPATSPAPATQDDPLTHLINAFVDRQQGLANGGTGSKVIPLSDDIMVNEEGLPIHEIREDEHGSLIGPPPEPVGGHLGPDVEEATGGDDVYWSEEAVTRRAALRKKLFNADSDSADDSEDDVQDVIRPSSSQSPNLSIPPSTTTDTQILPTQPPQSTIPATNLRSSLAGPSTSQPKGILKPPPRKKSVSFDASLPSPPASPDHPKPTSTRINGLSFPQPVPSSSNVPLLNLPTPSKAGERGFAGFKKGFLDKGKGKEKEKEKVVEVNEVMLRDEGKGGKSLFAQRMRGVDKGVIMEGSEVEGEGEGSSGNGDGGVRFPKMSESKGTASVKNSVVEKIPMISPKVERPASEIASQDLKQDVVGGPGQSPAEEEEGDILELDDIDSDGDAYDEDDDDEEDEEYDLDTALLAREAALELHRLRAHNHLVTNPYTRTPLTTDPDLEDGEYADPETGVMLALPSVSGFDSMGRPMIVNPSADDLRKSVRVGKLENGNLVLAPGEGEWSDDEVIGEVGKEERERNRDRAKRILLGKEVEEKKVDGGRKGKVDENEDVGMPPMIETDASPVAVSQPTRDVVENVKAGEEVAKAPPPAKKMSKFKAARMGI